ncbi:MAG: alginate export family protein [Acidobacteriota bacterium]
MKGILPFALLAAAGFGRAGEIQFSGSLRTRLEAWNWFEGAAENTYPFSGTLLRLSLSQTAGSLDWQVEAAAPLLLGLPDNAIAPGAQGQMGLGASYFAANQQRNAASLFPKQGWLRLKAAHGQSFRFGRMEFIDGTEVTPKNATLAALKRDRIAHRLLGNFGFSHVGRSFDGANYAVSGSRLNLTLLGARPTRGVFQTDGWGELNANVFYGALTGQTSRGGSGEWRVFGLGYSDYRDNVLKTDNRSPAARRADAAHINIGTYGGHVMQTAGPVDLLFWGVLQSGSWGALRHRAFAFAAEAGWQPGGMPKLRPWLRGGVNYGSGDKDPNDATHGTFFQVLPTPRIYARFPFFNMMNNRDVFGEAILRPGKKLSIRADVHRLDLAQKPDLWYSGGGMFQPWTFGFTGRASSGRSGLATLYDASADYAANTHLLLGAYFGHAAGGDVMKTIYPQGPNANFGYLEATLKF